MSRGFTQDWTEGLRISTSRFKSYQERPTSLLEVGVFEARSALWWFQSVLMHPKSHYTGIDDWWSYMTTYVPPEHSESGILSPMAQEKLQWLAGVRSRAWANLSVITKNRWTLIEAASSQALYELNKKQTRFDIVYIDGDHHFGACFLDSMLAWFLTNEVLIWGHVQPGWETNEAIRLLLSLIPDEYDILFFPDGGMHSQFAIKKRPGVPQTYLGSHKLLSQKSLRLG